jgi:hypothetical protein
VTHRAPLYLALAHLLVVPLVLQIALARHAHAHTRGVSQSELSWDSAEGQVTAKLVFAAAEIAGMIAVDADHDGAVTEAEVAAAKGALGHIAIAGVKVVADGQACAPEFDGASLEENDGLSITAHYQCPKGASELRVTFLVLTDLSETRGAHRHLARLTRVPGGAETVQKVLTSTSRELVAGAPKLSSEGAPKLSAPKPRSSRAGALLAVTILFTVGFCALFVWRLIATRRAKKSTPRNP